ncbi:MAG: F0F1 ATP synthase subunit B [Opitutales bacterium]
MLDFFISSGLTETVAAASAAAPEANSFVTIAENFGLKPELIVAQGINFILVMVVLWKFAVKPVVSTLDERQQKIADGLQYAEEMKTQLAEAERERAEKRKETSEEAQRILAEAREQAKELLEKKTQEATAQAEAVLRKASEATELERQKMLSDVRQEVARLVVETSAKVLSRELSDEEKQDFSETAAEELAGVER